MSGVTPDMSLPDLELASRPQVDNSGQAEFTKTAADYIQKPYMENLASQGRAFFNQHKAALAKIEQATGVDPYILVAIWGREGVWVV